MRRASHLLIGLGLALGLAVGPAVGADLRDLYFGEALYHAYQGQYFDAIQRLDTELALYHGLDEPRLDTLHYHINDAEFSVGDFELDYRMHQRAGRAVKAVLEGAVDESVRNEAAYRLARIQFQKDQLEDALQALARIQGKVPEGIRDDVEFLRANIDMATGRPGQAVEVLKRLRNDASLAGFIAYNLGIALLRAGWAEASVQQYDRALVPWSLLVEREPTDAAVQEAMLAVPHAYASLNLHGRAAIMYGRALEQLSKQIERVDASIASIREGRFLKALIREESREDETWVIRLRSLPEAPETYYLMEMMASHDFQTALHNYLDLEDLKARLMAWRTSLDAFDDLIRLRRQNYEPLLPEADAQFRELDSRMRLRLEQRKHLGERLQAMLTAPRPDDLATAEERMAGERIALIEKQLGNSGSPESLALRQRAARLRGVLTWRLETEYPERLTAAHAHLKELNAQVDALTRQYDAYVRTRQAATHSYVGYGAQIERLRGSVGEALQRVNTLMAQQGHMIETVAIDQLQNRQERLVTQQAEARYAVADSYDRAARAGQDAE